MSETTSVIVSGSLASIPQKAKVSFTDIQRRLAQGEKVPLRDLPGITEYDEIRFATVGVYYVYDLIFCANSKFFSALGGKGTTGTKRTTRRINGILLTHAFARRIPRREYLIRVENILKTMSN